MFRINRLCMVALLSVTVNVPITTAQITEEYIDNSTWETLDAEAYAIEGPELYRDESNYVIDEGMRLPTDDDVSILPIDEFDFHDDEFTPLPGMVDDEDFHSGFMQACQVDSDCIIRRGDCCGCEAGGIAVAVNKQHNVDWETAIDATCGKVMCPAMLSSDISCQAKEAVCMRGYCELDLSNAPITH